MEETPGVSFSVSHTTRSPRKGEVDEVDYNFVSEEKFRTMADQGEFLEWAEVHGNFYGTSRASVMTMLDKGLDVLLDIDVQGAVQVRDVFADAVLIFILPPSLEVVEDRLRNRGTDSEATIRLRMENARSELAALGKYQFLIINDDLVRAAGDLQSIVLARRCRAERVLARQDLSGMVAA
jgi:guanylate kinase